MPPTRGRAFRDDPDAPATGQEIATTTAAAGDVARRPARRVAHRRAAVAMLVMLGLSACGGPAPQPTPRAPQATALASPIAAAITATPTPVIPAAFGAIGSPVSRPAGEIGPVVWARAVDPATKAPVDRTTSFPADAPAIYAVLPVIRLAPDARLTAAWSYNGDSLDAFTQTVSGRDRPGAGWVEFHITRSDAVKWPAGDYAIEVRLDDAVVQTASVTIGEGS